MLYLILITFGVFVIFWLGDLVITVKTIKHAGHEIEANPLLRFLFKFRSRYIYIFKLLELGIFLYLIWFMTTFEDTLPFYILLGYILFYSLLVVNNAHIYYKVTEKESGTFKAVYVGLIFAMLLFIYLNYLLYQDLGTAFNAIGKCNDEYAGLYAQCSKEDKVAESESPREIDKILTDLNLSIRG